MNKEINCQTTKKGGSVTWLIFKCPFKLVTNFVDFNEEVCTNRFKSKKVY